MKTIAAFLCALAALLVPATARADAAFGVADNTGKYAPDAGATFFGQLAQTGMRENAITVIWDPAAPFAVSEEQILDRVVPQASAHGVRLVFVVVPNRAAAISRSPQMTASFGTFLQELVRRYPQVKDYAIGNEPNLNRFWQPQFNSDGSGASGLGYERLLASAYDALKAADPRVRVIGFGLSQRGNDDPGAASNPSTSPVRFIHDVGAAYRASGRTWPLMDAFAFHPYPGAYTDPISKGLPWPNAGVANLDRIKQAVWDAFHGTGQPTFETGLPLRITEVGWQAAVPAASLGAYTGQENVRVADEAFQADVYGQLVRQLECDPMISDVLFFLLIDESRLEGYQSGLLRADGTRRPAYDAVTRAIADTGGHCAGTPTRWRHTTGVVGGSVDFGTRARTSVVNASAGEDASYVAAIVRLPSNGAVDRGTIVRALEEGTPPQVPFLTQGKLRAYWREQIRFPTGSLASGSYVLAVSMTASLAADRSSLYVGKPFRVPALGPDVIRFRH